MEDALRRSKDVNGDSSSSTSKPPTESESDASMRSRRPSPTASGGEKGEPGQTKSSKGNGAGKKSTSAKKDRSNLRKGKWTAEEEEYTARIIQHFSTGLMTLPDGATLRSFLADKLNCDPMRITKKFTGACCLGKRVYHLRDRPQASLAEMEIAKAELDHLERRFRARIERDHSGVTLPHRAEDASKPTTYSNIFPNQAPNVSAVAVSNWIQQFAAAAANASIPIAPQPAIPANTGGKALPLLASAWANSSNSVGAQSASNETNASGSVSHMASSLSSVPSSTNSNAHTVVSPWAYVQAAATLAPALNQISVTNLQKQQQKLKEAYESQLNQSLKADAAPTESAPVETKLPSGSQIEVLQGAATGLADPKPSPSKQLQENYQNYLRSIQGNAKIVDAQYASIASNQPKKIPEKSAKTSNPTEVRGQQGETSAASGGAAAQTNPTGRRSEDREAGTILLGFLNTLRQSYEDAVVKTVPSETSQGNQQITGQRSTREGQVRVDQPRRNATVSIGNSSSKRPMSALLQSSSSTDRRKAASVTDTSTLSRSETSSGSSSTPNESSSSSAPNESSSSGANSGSCSSDDYDSKSDKTEADPDADPSSSEDSEKEAPIVYRKQGPPRKRMKLQEQRKPLTEQKRS